MQRVVYRRAQVGGLNLESIVFHVLYDTVHLYTVTPVPAGRALSLASGVVPQRDYEWCGLVG